MVDFRGGSADEGAHVALPARFEIDAIPPDGVRQRVMASAEIAAGVDAALLIRRRLREAPFGAGRIRSRNRHAALDGSGMGVTPVYDGRTGRELSQQRAQGFGDAITGSASLSTSTRTSIVAM